MDMLNVAAIVPCTECEGPGRRFALWVQGCLKRCPKCCNPQMFDLVPRTILSSEAVLEQIVSAREAHGIEGVSFLGGEPMLQAQGLASVARSCWLAGLSVVVFTGYTLAELDQLRLPGCQALLAATDLLVDGPYMADRPETVRNWAGSANQQFHFLSARYAAGIEFDPAYRPSVELRIGRSGELRANGWPTRFALRRP